MTCPLELPIADKNRASYIGSTDIRYIAKGEVGDLYRIKRGEIQEPNLDHVFKVQLGRHTEPFHAHWHAKTEGFKWGDEVFVIPGQRLPLPKRKLPGFVAASYDYWVKPTNQVLELKHTNARNGFRDCATYYMAQLQWQMLVSDERSMRFSIIPGNDDPVWGEVEADLVMQELLLEKAEAFWNAVEAGTPLANTGPDAAIAEAAAKVKIDGKRAYDMRKNNQWCALERRLIVGRELQSIGKGMEAELKALVPADASEVTGNLVSYTRTKAGALRVSIAETPDLLAEVKVAVERLAPAPEMEPVNA